MRRRVLLALGPVLVLASVGLGPAAWAQDYVGSAPGPGGDEVGFSPGPGQGGDYVGLPLGPGQGGDYVGLPLRPGQGGDDVGAGVMGVGVPLPPRGAELGRGARRADRGAVAPARPDGEERPVQGLPVSTTDVVLLGGLVIAGLALAARRAHSPR